MKLWPVVIFLLLALVVPAGANHVSVDALLQRVFNDPNPVAYDVTADFDGTFVFVWRGGRLTARLRGNYREWRAVAGQPRRRQVNITEIEVPLLLRPLVPGLKRLISERLDQEEGALEILDEYDVFIAEELPNGRYLLGGVRTDIVRRVMQRYGRSAEEQKDQNVRRAVAKWLYQPAQREMIVRPGNPYKVTLDVDEEGTYYSLLLQYDWGPVGTKLDWGRSAGRLIWRNIKMDAQMDAPGFGRIEGKLDLTFTNYCFNCTR
jgi:hypothetical protein